MHRRGPVAFVMTLFAAVALVTLLITASIALPAGPGFDTSVVHAAVTTSVPEPPITSDFLPEKENLSECVGFAERPGCGSKERGGWRQTVVFAVIVAALALIGWRISVGVRKNRSN